MKSGIIDYGGGNLQSVRNAVRALGHDPVLVRTPDDLASVSALIFPGQGAFGDCMAALNRQQLTDALVSWINADRPFFGICIGYQVLFSGSDENPGVRGLGAFPGQVVRFPSLPGVKVPHMGWNRAQLTHPGHPVWTGLGSSPYFYFVHSFYPEPEDDSLVAARTEYAGLAFAAAIQRGNVTATQFHPEKSQENGLTLIGNFLRRHAERR
jgi:glutamine amidotransferase